MSSSSPCVWIILDDDWNRSISFLCKAKIRQSSSVDKLEKVHSGLEFIEQLAAGWTPTRCVPMRSESTDRCIVVRSEARGWLKRVAIHRRSSIPHLNDDLQRQGTVYIYLSFFDVLQSSQLRYSEFSSFPLLFWSYSIASYRASLIDWNTSPILWRWLLEFYPPLSFPRSNKKWWTGLCRAE